MSVSDAWRTTHEPKRWRIFFGAENSPWSATFRSPTTMSASPARTGATRAGMSSAEYWLSASVFTITSAPTRSDASSPAWKATASPLFAVKRTTWSTPNSRATSTVRSLEPSSMTSHSTVSKPSTSRGSAASVCGSAPSSLRQGIWMTSFTARLSCRNPAWSAYDGAMDAAGPTRERSLWSLALLGVVGAALALRLWGIRHGLPFVYNPDELSHFVPKAVTFHAEGHFDPGYYVNPPAFSYLLYVVFAVVFGGSDGVVDAFAERPEDVFLAARVTAALVSSAAVAVLYFAGRRFFDRGVGLLAAAVLAVAFLPVHWSHQAVNDTPALLPVAAALLGSAGIFRLGRRRDYLLGGAAVGLAAATK